MKRPKLALIALCLMLTLVQLHPLGVAAEEVNQLAALLANSDRLITRGEFAFLLNSLLSFSDSTANPFDDVPQNHPYMAAITTAHAVGYMNGYGDGIFMPDAYLSGAEAAACLSFFLQFDPLFVELNEETRVAPWAKAAVSTLLDLGMLPLELTDKVSLTVEEASQFVSALITALQFPVGPYSLQQTNAKDDFFAFMNRSYLATATVHPGNVMAATFSDVDFMVRQQISSLLAEILSTDSEPGSDAWKIKELYGMYLDVTARAASIENILPIIDEIKAVSSIEELTNLASEYYPSIDLLSFYTLQPASDARVDATKWCGVIIPGNLQLGTRDYYADEPFLEPIHAALRSYIASLLAYVGETEDLDSRAAAIFAIEQSNALASMPLELFNDPEVIYREVDWLEMEEITAAYNRLNYSQEVRLALSEAHLYCPDQAYVEHIDTLFTAANLETLKDIALVNTISTFGDLVGEDIIGLADGLRMALFGDVVELPSLEVRAQMLVTNLLSESFSKLYAEKLVTPKVKADVTNMVKEIRAKYSERILALSWMSEETKEKALEKLDAMKTYVAYPDDYTQGRDFEVVAKEDGGNLIDIYMAYSEAENAHMYDLITKPYELNLWDGVPTYTVNAFYSSTENALIVPAGILQEPFYSSDAKSEVNLGAIGAIIAHEISHAFDNNGAQFDKDGTLRNWWTEADYEAFQIMTDAVANALSEIVFVGENTVNGVLCTGETVADLGAMACVIDVASAAEDADLALVYEAWARIWASRMSPDVANYLLAIDVHAPNKVRVNFTISQLNSFYEIYEVGEDDGMYVAPEQRLIIW